MEITQILRCNRRWWHMFRYKKTPWDLYPGLLLFHRRGLAFNIAWTHLDQPFFSVWDLPYFSQSHDQKGCWQPPRYSLVYKWYQPLRVLQMMSAQGRLLKNLCADSLQAIIIDNPPWSRFYWYRHWSEGYWYNRTSQPKHRLNFTSVPWSKSATIFLFFSLGASPILLCSLITMNIMKLCIFAVYSSPNNSTGTCS